MQCALLIRGHSERDSNLSAQEFRTARHCLAALPSLQMSLSFPEFFFLNEKKKKKNHFIPNLIVKIYKNLPLRYICLNFCQDLAPSITSWSFVFSLFLTFPPCSIPPLFTHTKEQYTGAFRPYLHCNHTAHPHHTTQQSMHSTLLSH